MGRIVLQMMMSLDGMVSGPNGELDWIAGDEELLQEHLARVEESSLILMGAGVYAEITDFWAKTAEDDTADETNHAIGRAMTAKPRAVFGHEAKTVKPQDTMYAVKDDNEFVAAIRKLKQETDGLIVSYGGVRLARSLVRLDVLDEIHVDVCPVLLSEGQPLFVDLPHRTDLRLRESATYASGTTMLHYEWKRA